MPLQERKVYFDIDLTKARNVPGFWYVASPYSKHPRGIEVAFQEVVWCVYALTREGLAAYSPIAATHPTAQLLGIDPLDHEIWIPYDRPMMHAAHGLIIATMDGWEKSHGISEEVREFELAGKPIFMFKSNTVTYVEKAEPIVRESILDEAKRITSGDRRRDYDAALPNHKRIADLWNAYIENRKCGRDAPLTPENVAWLMVFLKAARDLYTPKRDNLVDGCGYLRCIAQMRGDE